MEKPLPIINQNNIIPLYKERFDNPETYADKPLIIWRSILNDDVELSMHEIISECNKGKKREDYNYMALRRLGVNRIKDTGFGIAHTIKPEIHKICVVYFDIANNETNGSVSFEEYSDWFTKDRLKKLNEEIGVPVILHLPFIEKPDSFSGYSQYVFNPDFNEWKEELSKYDQPLLTHLIGFLESFESEEDRDYRWYWYFQRQRETDNSSDLKRSFKGNGCDFPSCWIEGIYKLRGRFILPMAQIPKNYIPPKPVKISEIPVEEFKTFFKEGISEDVIEEFRNYLIEHNVEIQGNI